MAIENPNILELTKENFSDSINDHPFAVVDFWAPWCGPCRAFAPVFAAAAVKYPNALFAKLNTEDQQDIAAQFGIRSIPTLMIFRDNVIIYSEPGALPAGALDQVLVAAQALDMEAVKRELASQSDTTTANA